jgi:hypothetical protein
MVVKVTFRPNGRFGNNVFQYIATKVIQKYIPNSCYVYNEIIKKEDNVFIITEDNWNDTLQSLRNKKEDVLKYDLYYCDGYFQFNDFIEEEQDYIKSLFSVDNKDMICSGMTMSCVVFFVSHYNTPFTDDDLVVHFRLDDFIMDGKKSAIIHPDSYLHLLRQISPQFNGKLYIVVDKIKYPFEQAYLQTFNEFNPIILSGHMLEDFARCFWAKNIVLSNSTFCWIPLIFGPKKRHWFPKNVGVFTNQRFDYIDDQSILFDTKRLTF